MSIKVLMLLGVLLMVIAFSEVTQAVWIQSKAMVAQTLLNRAWQRSQQSIANHKPWSWADISPVGKLEIPDRDLSLIVLNDDSGEALAFGPGLVAGDVEQLNGNTVAIGGHRDTHLAFIKGLTTGSSIYFENRSGQRMKYTVTQKQIVDSRNQTVSISQTQAGLVLITCYPFNAQSAGGPLRMVLTARALR